MFALELQITRFNPKKDENISIIRLKRSFDDLIDLLTLRVHSKSYEDLANGLLEQVFDIRIDLLMLLAKFEKDYISKLFSGLEPYGEGGKYKNLENSLSKSMLCYKKILSPLLHTTSFDNIFNSFEDRPNYNSLRFLSVMPPASGILDFINSSIHFEVALILADLVLMEKISLTQQELEKKLIPFLDRSLIRFGAHAINNGIYKPVDYDLDETINSMYILASNFQMKSKNYSTTPVVDFLSSINN